MLRNQISLLLTVLHFLIFICYIEIEIDNISLLEKEEFYGSFLYLEELKKSIQGPGKYLIFTGVNGVADDAGWDLIEVLHLDGIVKWNFQRESTTYNFLFNRDNYIVAVQLLEDQLKKSCPSCVLEPKHVIFPE